jgi:hypothetical protein
VKDAKLKGAIKDQLTVERRVQIFAVAMKPTWRGISGSLSCVDGANIRLSGNAPAKRNLGISPPLLPECVGDNAFPQNGALVKDRQRSSIRD